MTLTAAAVGAAVAVAGTIGFALVSSSLILCGSSQGGPSHHVVLARHFGAVLVVVADVVARMIVAPAELPIGIIMAIVERQPLHLVIKRGGVMSAP